MKKINSFDLNLFNYNRDLKKYLGMTKYLIESNDFNNALKTFHSCVLIWAKTFVKDVSIKNAEDDELVLYGLIDSKDLSENDIETVREYLIPSSNMNDLIDNFNNFVCFAKNKIVAHKYKQKENNNINKIVDSYKEKENINQNISNPKVVKNLSKPQTISKPTIYEYNPNPEPKSESCLCTTGVAQQWVDRSNPRKKEGYELLKKSNNYKNTNSTTNKAFKSQMKRGNKLFLRDFISNIFGITIIFLGFFVLRYVFAWFAPDKLIDFRLKIVLYSLFYIANIIELAMMFHDKKVAMANGNLVDDGTFSDDETHRRIPEIKLLTFGFLGALGLRSGMNAFYHKTDKIKFNILSWLFVIIQVYLLIFVIV